MKVARAKILCISGINIRVWFAGTAELSPSKQTGVYSVDQEDIDQRICAGEILLNMWTPLNQKFQRRPTLY